MQFTQVSLAAVATSAAIPLNAHSNPNWQWQVSGGATATYSVEWTLDNIYDTTVTPTWQALASASGLTANGGANQRDSVRAVRLNVTAYTSGTVTLKVLQGTPA
jgi:hypothetical protein